MELALLHTLTHREFYKANRNLVKEKIFRSKETRAIKFILDKAVEYLKAKLITSKSDRRSFLMDELKLTSTEYLEALNKATNGGLVNDVWNN